MGSEGGHARSGGAAALDDLVEAATGSLVMRELVELARATVGGEGAALALSRGDDAVIGAHAGLPAHCPPGTVLEQARSLLVPTRGDHVAITDVASEGAAGAALAEKGIHRWLAVPLPVAAGPAAGLCVCRETAGPWSSEDVQALRRIAAPVSAELSRLSAGAPDADEAERAGGAFFGDMARALGALDDIIFHLRVRDDGTLEAEFLNEATERFLGGPLPAGEDPVDVWFSRVHPDDVAQVEAAFAQTLETGTAEVLHRIRGFDGRLRWAWARNRSYIDPEGRLAAAGIVRDATAQRSTEEALRASEQRFRSLIQQLPVMVWTTDADGIVTLSEGGALAAIGLEPGQTVGQSVFSFGDEDGREMHRRALAGEAVRQINHYGDRVLDGHYVPLRGPDGSVAGMLGVGVDVTEQAQARAEQEALRRVATAVAAGEHPASVFATVASEVATLLDVDASAVLRVVPGADPEVVAVRGSSEALVAHLARQAWRQGESRRAARWAAGETVVVDGGGEGGLGGMAGVPVAWRGRLWGLVVAAARAPGTLTEETAARLGRFAPLIALALANAESRRRLEEEATTDPLTGLANHRRFHEQLRDELRRARRHGHDLALALIDIDHFKELNDAYGHHGGDEVLQAVARRLGEDRRAGEMLARVGGDEFALILPETEAHGACAAVERLRERVVQESAEEGRPITLSAGIADLGDASTVDELLRFADGALYWAKEHGRNTTWRYSAEVEDALSDRERADRLARAQSMSALRSLARALDLRDPSTRRHSERVAALAAQVAAEMGWGTEAVRRLRDAALVHDVGKIGTPDQILHKAGPLTGEEYDRIKEHAELGAMLAGEALGDDQVAWIRHHHERWDGAGYPAGLAGEAVPEGARVIAVADAFDVMTNARHYREPVPHAEALAECLAERERQFCPTAVAALERVVLRGALTG